MAKERSIEGEGCKHSPLRHSFSAGDLSRCASTTTFLKNKEDKASLSSLFYHNNPQFYDEALSHLFLNSQLIYYNNRYYYINPIIPPIMLHFR